MLEPHPSRRRALILTAIPLEYKAVRFHLHDLQPVTLPQGTRYEGGRFEEWDVLLGEVGMGGPNAALEAERAINYFRPEVAFFVGIAGGIKDVQHGDVVAATKVYGYEFAKIKEEKIEARPSIGSSSYRLEQLAKTEAKKNDWHRRIATLPQIPPRVFVGPIAAGEKVMATTASPVWEFVRTHYSDALAVEMEGHGFLRATHANPLVEALIIRGISDLVEDKGAINEERAQQAAAEYASAFAFELLAQLALQPANFKHPASRPQERFGAPFPEIWNVSRRHSTFFTGRDHLIKRLSDAFSLSGDTGLPEPQALHGLGGLGKTQTAAEYAYRHRGEYETVLWVRAETEHEVLADITGAARLLKLPAVALQEKESLIDAMMDWFMTHSSWLLVLDNADRLSLVEPFLPKAARGHILLTTRTHATRMIAQALELESLDPEDGALCLLQRANYLRSDENLRQASRVQVEAARKLSRLMDGLPLALEQAGAYIEATGCGVSGYLRVYENDVYRAQIQGERQGEIREYPDAVAHAWTFSRERVHRDDPAATDLLSLCAFLAPEAIPDELFTYGASALSFHHVMSILLQASLVQREVDRERDIARFSIHRVMQDLLKAEMDEKVQKMWAERALQAVVLALPVVTWSVMQPHIEQCVAHIQRYDIHGSEAEQLLRLLEGTNETRSTLP